VVFGNCLGQISFAGRAAQLVVQQSRPYDEDAGPELKTVIELDLVAGARSTPQDIAVESRPRRHDGPDRTAPRVANSWRGA
jgi:hypothetical protein